MAKILSQYSLLGFWIILFGSYVGVDAIHNISPFLILITLIEPARCDLSKFIAYCWIRRSIERDISSPLILSTLEISLIILPLELTSISLCPALPTRSGLKDFSNPSLPISKLGIFDIKGSANSCWFGLLI